MDITTNLANLHARYGLFSKNDFEKKEGNILVRLKQFNEFSYLSNFYNEYIACFTNNTTHSNNTKESIKKDLPFIGEKVIKKQKAEFIFYFEGSLAKEEKLSITVLSHLWLINDQNIINAFCGKELWWTHANFNNIKNRLNLSPKVVSNSYITDAIRFGKEQSKKNRELAFEEISLLNPQVVICVGTKARDTIGMRYLSQETKFHFIKFPKYHNENEIYNHLNEILNPLCN